MVFDMIVLRQVNKLNIIQDKPIPTANPIFPSLINLTISAVIKAEITTKEFPIRKKLNNIFFVVPVNNPRNCFNSQPG